MKKILVVGQTPPPYGGQAMMIQYMLDGKYEKVEMYHVRMCFSREFNDRGKFSIYKVMHIFTVIWNVWKLRFGKGIHTMYYPVSSAPKVALLRDAIILMCTRWLFKEVVYHFHAAGVSEELPKYPQPLQGLVYWILKKPELAITSSEHNPKDAEYLKAKKVEVIPLGIPDRNEEEVRRAYGANNYLTVMFMGLLNGTKGEGYVLEAVNMLNKNGYDVRFEFAGKFENEEYEDEFFTKVNEYGLHDKVKYYGIVTGDDKKRMFLDADVFCFPSYFSSESFGIVLLEGMMYQMPLIASKWRGIQSVVEDGKNGFLVDIKNSEQIAEALTILYDNRSLLEKMAKESRQMFVEKYVLGKYLQNMENAMVYI